MIEGLRRTGIEVIECHESLWRGVEDRIQVASGGWMYPGFWWRIVKTYIRLLWKYRCVKDYDILIIGYPGQYDVFMARALSWLHRKPLVWDVLNSMYLITLERGLAQRHPLSAELIRILEGFGCLLPDRLILDTTEFVEWFQNTYRIKPGRFRLVPIGADDQAFRNVYQEIAVPSASKDGIFRVLYYGSYIPNHGVDIVVEAAKLLQTETSIHFELIGDGPEKEKAVMLAKRYDLKNLTFVDWLDKTELVQRIASCDICLGTFGDTLQASLTNNNKIYEGFVMCKPVISGISPAIPKVLNHGEHLYLCERGNPSALSNAIRILKEDPVLCQRLGQNGHDIFTREFDVNHIGQIFATHLEELLSQ
jgi:glycosyltransferase involved in cell wall biosynthesis